MISISESFIPHEEGNLWLGRMGNPAGQAVLLIHGAIENSRIFYNEKGKGLAPYLAENGYDVFLTDLRGKGKSIPLANTKIKGGQFEVIMHDIPAVVNKINELKQNKDGIHLMAHSWGGVLLSSWLARYSTENSIRSVTFFACKRKIYVHHFKRWFMVDLMWTTVGSLATLINGYLPAKRLKMGSDDEPKKFFFECNRWVYSNRWIDPRDGFNYKDQFKKINFPSVLSLTGKNDHSLGNRICVKKMLDEIGPSVLTNIVLSKENGNRQDYDHVNILTHADAPNDHFPLVLNWLNQHN
jgi:predicted alpha/beta hydrolase